MSRYQKGYEHFYPDEVTDFQSVPPATPPGIGELVLGDCEKDLEELKQLVRQRQQELRDKLPEQCQPPFDEFVKWIEKAETDLASLEAEAQRQWVTILNQTLGKFGFLNDIVKGVVGGIMGSHRDRICLAIRAFKIMFAGDLQSILDFFISPEARRETIRQIVGAILPPCPAPVKQPLREWITQRGSELLEKVLKDIEGSKQAATVALQALAQELEKNPNPTVGIEKLPSIFPDPSLQSFLQSLAGLLASLILAAAYAAAYNPVNPFAKAAGWLVLIIMEQLRQQPMESLIGRPPEAILSELPNKDALEQVTIAYLEGNETQLAAMAGQHRSVEQPTQVASNFSNDWGTPILFVQCPPWNDKCAGEAAYWPDVIPETWNSQECQDWYAAMGVSGQGAILRPVNNECPPYDGVAAKPPPAPEPAAPAPAPQQPPVATPAGTPSAPPGRLAANSLLAGLGALPPYGEYRECADGLPMALQIAYEVGINHFGGEAAIKAASPYSELSGQDIVDFGRYVADLLRGKLEKFNLELRMQNAHKGDCQDYWGKLEAETRGLALNLVERLAPGSDPVYWRGKHIAPRPTEDDGKGGMRGRAKAL